MNYDNQDPEDDDRKRDSSRKRDGKKEKKDKGYQMFEEEDSEDEQSMSPSKNKIIRVKPSFKFPVRKEKTKEKEEKKDKDVKEKRKEEKEGKKIKKDKKKSKHAKTAEIVVPPSQCENPIFGVPLAKAVELNKSHDGIEVPVIVRECIDYIEECGLSCEGIYRISGVKSKVQHLKDAYNRHETVHLYEHEPNVVASLLKQFLREMPEKVLTNLLMPKFEEASVIKNVKKRNDSFYRLIYDLPTCNRLLLSWMIVHMSHVIDLAKENKMTLQNVSIVLSPTMQISHRVLNVLFSNVNDIFGNVTLRKYVPPLRPAHSKWSLDLPDNVICLEEELAKQESLLQQLHVALNAGITDPVKEEQLWEVQRVVTQLKRKIKAAKMSVRKAEMKRSSQTSIPSLSCPEELHLGLRAMPTEAAALNVKTVAAVVESKQADTIDVAKAVSNSSEEESKKSVKFITKDEKESLEANTSKSDLSEINKKSVKAEVNMNIENKSKDNKLDEDNNDLKDKQKPQSSVMSDETEKETDSKKQSDAESKTPIPEDAISLDDRPKDLPVMRKDVKPAERPPSITGQKKTPSPPGVTSPALVKDVVLPQKTVKLPESAMQSKPDTEIKEEQAEEPKPAKQKGELEQKKPVLPPFMSTVLLQPMKAETPKPKSSSDNDEKADEESQLRWEKLRELEEELLGEKKKKVLSESESEVSETDDEKERDIEQLLDEEFALQMEDEELLTIADELKQKMATEHSEIERLKQELQEVAYLRHDSDLEDMSDSDNSSDDSEDEEDLYDILTNIIQDNQDMEMHNSELCNKIHEERMICLSVKLQIRLLQHRQAENTYG